MSPLGQAFVDLCLITFIVTTCFAVLGCFEWVLELLERVGRRIRGTHEHAGHDRDRC